MKLPKLPNLPDWLLVTSSITALVIIVLCASYFFIQYHYKNRIYPGVQVAGMNLGGRDYDTARTMTIEKISAFDEGLMVVYKDRQIFIAPRVVALSADSANQLVVFDVEATLHNAIGVGRSESLPDNITEQVSAMIGLYSLGLSTTVDRVLITEQLKNSFVDLEKKSENSKLIIGNNNEITIKPAEQGLAFNYDQTVNYIIDHFETGNKKSVVLEAEIKVPEIQVTSAGDVQTEINRLLAVPTVTLTYNTKKWTITKPDMTSWINLIMKNKKIIVGFDQEIIKNFLIEKIVPDVNIEPLPPRLQIEKGRVSVWQAGRDGVVIDLEATSAALAEIADNQNKEVVIITKVEKNPLVNQSAQDLGLKEIIGTGISHFAGSPANRRHNIKVGADALNGLLIKPGEEFSLLKALGEIDAKSGYLPELVIKENKTIPEYGGGLCQIGTTAFRATFNSGLPVTARRNHSYRVVYYEPAGTDATIYDPAPDYKFVNDTSHHILIQTRIEKDDVIFDFWGTKDGREVNVGKPVIYNIVAPAPTKIIETTDLPEGEKKCTEKAHAGADAYFDYQVTYQNGEEKNQRFSSHYVPWQAVCLVGVKKIAPDGGTPTGTITPSVTPTVTP